MKAATRILPGLLLVSLLSAAPARTQPATGSPVPSNDEIRALLEQRVGEDGDRIGIVVGVIEPGGRRFVSHGGTGGETPARVDEHTLFEIGSVTKVFTALALADMAESGEVGLDDRVSRYLPDGVDMPGRDGRAITLVDLATHTSGLPRLPSNMSPADMLNPYADYTVEQLYAFVSSHELTREPGTVYEYSNLGAGLLGHVLAQAAGTGYEQLVRTRILEPLDMDATAVTLNDALRARLATGHDSRRESVPGWDLPTLAGAGALRSTADDLVRFLALHLGYTESRLAPAARRMRAITRPAGELGRVALGWHVSPTGSSEIVWHNGGTGGYRAFVGFDAEARVGVVALTNVQQPLVDDIGRHLLDTGEPLVPADSPLLSRPPERTETTLAPEVLERYTGRYAFGPEVIATITRDGAQLYAELTGQGRTALHPESETRFFVTGVDAEITFRTDDDGRVNALVLRQSGHRLRFERTE